MKKYTYLWMSIALLVVVVFGSIYMVVQQAQRNDADYPQIQMAEDTAAILNGGAAPGTVVNGSVIMGKSLAPFTLIFDKNGNIVNGNGYLRGTMPKIPMGVLTAAKGHDYHRVTWQPAGDVRIAAVAVAADNYYVVSGRSLKVVEQNIQRTLALCVFGGLVSLVVLSAAFVAYRPVVDKR